MFDLIKKENRKDFSSFIKAKKAELALLKETNKFLKNATELKPLNEWYQRKFYSVRPNGIVEENYIKRITIVIDDKGISIQGEGADGSFYDDKAFLDYESAKDIGEMVAGTYKQRLLDEKDWHNKELRMIEKALATAKEPPKEDTKNVKLPDFKESKGKGKKKKSNK